MNTIKNGRPNVLPSITGSLKKLNVIGLSINFIISLLLITAMASCNTSDDKTTTESRYSQTNLVSDVSTYGASRVDANLVNPWGIAISPSGSFWIAANHSSYTTIYDRNGNQLLAPITIASHGLINGGAPTGVIYNSHPSNFLGAKYIYAGEDGTISIWISGGLTLLVADRSAQGAVYKGIAIAVDGDADFLYLANFKGKSIDVFDVNFNFVTSKPFNDASIPAGFAPFNIYNHDGKLYVTYAKQKGPDNEDDEAGVGNGYVNIFNPDGSLFKRFATQGTLNSPWGLVDAPAGFGLGSEIILVGNFGDGKINIYDADGGYKGQLKDTNGYVLSIEGLWALTFPEDGIPAGDQNQLFFTAGPADETHGIFGYLSLK